MLEWEIMKWVVGNFYLNYMYKRTRVARSRDGIEVQNMIAFVLCW